MRIMMYGACSMLIVITTFLLLSFEKIDKADISFFFNEFSLTVPDSVAVFSTVPVRFTSTSRTLRSGVVLFKISDNRLWNRSDTVIPLKNISHVLDFNCSFTDTGLKTIECFIISPNNVCKNISRQIVIYSPLKPLIQRAGVDSLTLSTPTVHDSVNYVWEFDNGLIVYNCAPRITLPKHECKYRTGKLYVESAHFKSPEVKFSFGQNGDDLELSIVTLLPENQNAYRYVYK